MGPTIRDFRESDASQVAALSNKNSGFFQYGRVTPEFLKDMNAQNNYRMFVAEENDEICGFCGARYEGGIAELGPICVNGAYRNKGVGTVLLKHVMLFLVGQGISRTLLKVKKANKNALRFFMANGFVTVKEVDCRGPAQLLVYRPAVINGATI